ncbi:MAG: hypothetical protein AAB592_04820, partial [Patescibacteria group bacterium]
MGTKVLSRRYTIGFVAVAVALAIFLLVRAQLSSAADSTPRPLKVASVTLVSSSNPAANYSTNTQGQLQNDNYGISVWTESASPAGLYTECGTLGLPATLTTGTAASANTWEFRNTCNGYIAIGAADDVGAQVLTLTGNTTDGKNFTLNVNVPAVPGDSLGNWRFYVDDTGGTYFCRANHAYGGTYPNDCDLSATQAVTSAHLALAGSAPVNGNNLCQAGEDYINASADCPAPALFDYAFTSSSVPNTIIAGNPTIFTVKVVKTVTGGPGTDTATLSVKENDNVVSWCSASPSSITGAVASTTDVTINCNVPSTYTGAKTLVLEAASSANAAISVATRTFFRVSFGFSVTQPATTTTGTNGTIPSTWKKVVWNSIGLESYVSINTPQAAIDAARVACANFTFAQVTWPNPDDFSKPETVGVPSCSGTPTPTPTPTPTSPLAPRNSGECYEGETCPSTSWCTQPASTASYSPMNNSWLDACYTTAGQLTCVKRTNENVCGPMPMQACPAGASHCRPDDKNCRESGQTGPKDAWCWSGKKCFNSTSTEVKCMDWSASCPTDYPKVCDANDKNCIEPGQQGPLEGWCAGSGSENCYSKDGSHKLCVVRDDWNKPMTCPDPAATSPMIYTFTSKCPDGYSQCNPTDKLCTAVGETNPNQGAWCMNGKSCNTNSGVTCADWNAECPKGSTLCRKDDQNCFEPGASFTYSKYNWPWCPEGMPMYSLTEYNGYCASRPMSTDKDYVPDVKKGYGFCRLDQPECLEPGETGKGWCAWMPYNSTGIAMPYGTNGGMSTITCPVLGGDNVVTPTEPEQPIVITDEQAEKESRACMADAKRMLEEVTRALGSSTTLASNDVKILKDASASIESSMIGWNDLATSKAWKKLRDSCVSQRFEWETRDLADTLRRIGTGQGKDFIFERIAGMRKMIESLKDQDEDFSNEVEDLIDKIEDILDDTDDALEDGDYESAKRWTKSLEKYGRLLNYKLQEFDIDFEENVQDALAKHIEEKVMAKVSAILEERMQNFANVMTELVEKNMQKMLDDFTAIAEKLTQQTIDAAAKAIENATYIAEERVKEIFLKRLNDMTSTVRVMSDEFGDSGVFRLKVQELSGILLSNAWTEETANELQGDIATMLASRGQGAASSALIAQIDAIVTKAKEHLSDDDEGKVLIDEGILGFLDAPLTRWDGGMMLSGKNMCIVKGRGDDPYRADATRNAIYQEAVALTIRTAGIELSDDPLRTPVSGLPSDAWSVPYFRTLQDTGYNTGTIAYNADATRVEAAKLMYALLKKK